MEEEEEEEKKSRRRRHLADKMGFRMRKEENGN